MAHPLFLVLPFALAACDGSVTDPNVMQAPVDPSLSISTSFGVFTYFDDFNLGMINGQQDWLSLGAAGGGCATYDHAVVANTYGPIVNRVLFRTAGDAAPATAGKGFLIDNLVVATY